MNINSRELPSWKLNKMMSIRQEGDSVTQMKTINEFVLQSSNSYIAARQDRRSYEQDKTEEVNHQHVDQKWRGSWLRSFFATGRRKYMDSAADGLRTTGGHMIYVYV